MKRPKPTFDVAREPIADARSGWVYRSDAAGALPPAAPTPSRAPAPAAPRFVPADPPAPRTRGWVESGLYLMVLPMAIGMSLMIAPVAWIIRSRSQK